MRSGRLIYAGADDNASTLTKQFVSESCNKDGSDTTETDQNLQSIVRKMKEKGESMDTAEYRKHYFAGNPCPNRYIQLMYPLRDAKKSRECKGILVFVGEPFIYDIRTGYRVGSGTPSRVGEEAMLPSRASNQCVSGGMAGT